MIRKLLKHFQTLALLAARIAVGAVLIMRGWHRWFDAGIPRQAEVLAEGGMPAADLLAWLVTMFEVVGGVLLIAGLATRFVGAGMIAMHTVLLLQKLDAGFMAGSGGYEYHLVLAALGLLFLAFGCGKLGADALFFAPREVSPNMPPMPVEPRETEKTLYSQ